MDEKLLQRFIELDAIPAGRSQDHDIQWGEHGLLIVSDLAKEVLRLRERDKLARQYIAALVDTIDSDTFCDMVENHELDGIRTWQEEN